MIKFKTNIRSIGSTTYVLVPKEIAEYVKSKKPFVVIEGDKVCIEFE